MTITIDPTIKAALDANKSRLSDIQNDAEVLDLIAKLRTMTKAQIRAHWSGLTQAQKNNLLATVLLWLVTKA